MQPTIRIVLGKGILAGWLLVSVAGCRQSATVVKVTPVLSATTTLPAITLTPVKTITPLPSIPENTITPIPTPITITPIITPSSMPNSAIRQVTVSVTPIALDIIQQPLSDDTITGTLKLNQSAQSHLSDREFVQWIFKGDAGMFITIITTPLTNDLDLTLRLISPDGKQMLDVNEGYAGDPELVVGIELPITGEYIIQLRNLTDKNGDYSVSVTAGINSTANFHDAGDLMYGQTREEHLPPHEVQIWFFAGNANDNITVEVFPQSEGLDLEIWLLDSQVALLWQEDMTRVDEWEILTYTLPKDESYLILVREFFGVAGEYEISLKVNE